MKVGEIKRLSNKTRAWLQIYYGEKQERNDLKQEPLKRDIWICLPSAHKHHPRMNREREENHTCEWSSPTRSIKTQQTIILFPCLVSHLTLFITASPQREVPSVDVLLPQARTLVPPSLSRKLFKLQRKPLRKPVCPLLLRHPLSFLP